MAIEDPGRLELTLNRFRRLIGELQRGLIARNCFDEWEIEILMDLENCRLNRRHRIEVLRRYCKVVEKQMEEGEAVPMKLSQFLAMHARKGNGSLN